MSISALAQDFVQMCKEGRFEECGEKYWAADVISREPPQGGPMDEVRGLAGVRAKGEWWYANHTVHSVEVGGPYVHGNRFVVRFTMDITPKESGQRVTMDEVGLYTVENGRIAVEEFFYGAA